MPKRKAVHQIHLRREGKEVIVKPGQVFDFSADELASLKDRAPNSFKVVEAEELVETDAQRDERIAAETAANEAKAKAAAEKATADRKAAEEKAAADRKAAAKAPAKGGTSANDL